MIASVFGHSGMPAPELPGGVKVGQSRLPQSLRAILSPSRLQNRLRGAAAWKERQGPPGRLSGRIEPNRTPGVDLFDLVRKAAPSPRHILQQPIQVLPPGLGHDLLQKPGMAVHGSGDQPSLSGGQLNLSLSGLRQRISDRLTCGETAMQDHGMGGGQLLQDLAGWAQGQDGGALASQPPQ